MARRWTTAEEGKYRRQLKYLYLEKNKAISEIAEILKLSDAGVYDRLKRLRIPTCRDQKLRFNNRRNDIVLPTKRSAELAELMGLMLGDGCVTHYQVSVTLGTKELSYAKHVRKLLKRVFGGTPKISIRSNGHKTVYLGSTRATDWLMREGLVRNKVSAQVGVPPWVFKNRMYMESFLRGFFDTDGSVYRLRYGVQISFTNHSRPLLSALQKMLKQLGYKASELSAYRVYLTRIPDVKRFFREIKPANQKHMRRYREIMRRSYSGNYTRL